MRATTGHLASGHAISERPPPGQYALWRSCLRKLPYSRVNGERSATVRNILLPADAVKYHAYRCDHCGQFHVGHDKVQS